MRPIVPCPVAGCPNTSRPNGSFQGLCGSHMQRRKRYGLDIKDLGLADAVTHCQACGIELTETPSGRKAPVDHDHEHGHVRGILCHACNTAEGCIRDREHVARLMSYIDRTRNPDFDWAADRRAWLAERAE